jgi:hypothetical protein
MRSTLADFNHRALRQPRSIRTLALFPADDPEEPLQCELKEISFEKGRKYSYEALSYAWGDPSPENHIICHGKRLTITENCEAALRRLRRQNRSRTLWVDSICIDQSSILERNEQVKLMGDIYRHASRVLVWLGPGTKKTDTAMENIALFEQHNSSGMMAERAVLDLYKSRTYSMSGSSGWSCPESLLTHLTVSGEFVKVIIRRLCRGH